MWGCERERFWTNVMCACSHILIMCGTCMNEDEKKIKLEECVGVVQTEFGLLNLFII